MTVVDPSTHPLTASGAADDGCCDAFTRFQWAPYQVWHHQQQAD